jgi:hypothetical protein
VIIHPQQGNALQAKPGLQLAKLLLPRLWHSGTPIMQPHW